MLRIALGSDHRGGKIAESLLRQIWFRNQWTSDDDRVPLSQEGYEIKDYGSKEIEIMSPLVGAIEFQSSRSSSNPLKYIGSDLSFLLVCDKNQTLDEYTNGNGNGNLNSMTYYADYPDIAAIVAKKVSCGEVDNGILICGTGLGMCIVANKFPNIRAAFCHSELTAELSRKHNDANILCLSGEMIGESAAVAIVLRWLNTDYLGGRHQTRIDKIRLIEEETGL
ncbi:MAG: RpiB/LacA/LacB family sugar-phosphate isomerase [Planctomycetia bacterium]|nr:RpiB/LacA/LacB family sugar-phosphate isomerase [Planctomycetia bacterium]